MIDETPDGPAGATPDEPRLRAVPDQEDQLTAEHLEEAREAYERLVTRYEVHAERPGVHWDGLTELEQQYWARVYLALRAERG